MSFYKGHKITGTELSRVRDKLGDSRNRKQVSKWWEDHEGYSLIMQGIGDQISAVRERVVGSERFRTPL